MSPLPARAAREPGFWLARPTRLRAIPRRWALGIVFALAAFAAIAVATSGIDMRAGATDAAEPGITDLLLYQTVIAGIRGGDNYYPVALDALRAGDYPLRPFVTVRLPMLAVLLAAAAPLVAAIAQWGLALAVIATWYRRIAEAIVRPPGRIAGLILLAGGMAAFVDVDLAAFHEIWAAMLVALAIGMRRPGRWVEAAAIGLIAMLVRETAALAVVVMMAAAWIEGHRHEALGWLATLCMFAVVLVFHAVTVGALTGPLDATSPGWAGWHGPGLFLRAASMATALTMLPPALGALLVLLALFGWAAWGTPLGLRVTATLIGYAAVIAAFGRLDTFYWGLMAAPVLLVGLAFVPDAARDLFRATLDRRRVRVVRVHE